jgi:hypothetical protein
MTTTLALLAAALPALALGVEQASPPAEPPASEAPPPEPPKEPAKEPAPTPPKDARLTLSALDGKLTFSPDFFADFRYEGVHQDRDTPSSSSFRFRRFRPGVGGKAILEQIRYRIQLEAAPGATSAAVSLLDGYFDFTFCDWAKLRVGQTKVPYSRQYLTGSSELQMTDTASAVDAFVGGREIGLITTFAVLKDVLDLSAGIFNGNGGNKIANDNSEHMLVARLNAHVVGKMPYTEGDLDRSASPGVGVGVSAMRNGRNPTKTVVGSNGLPTEQVQPKVEDDSLGGDAAFRWKGAFATAEYHWRRSRKGQAVQHSRAGFVQAGYLVWKGLEVVARGGLVTPNLDAAQDHTKEVQVETNWYFNRHQTKLQLLGAWTRQDVGPRQLLERKAIGQIQVGYW